MATILFIDSDGRSLNNSRSGQAPSIVVRFLKRVWMLVEGEFGFLSGGGDGVVGWVRVGGFFVGLIFVELGEGGGVD